MTVPSECFRLNQAGTLPLLCPVHRKLSAFIYLNYILAIYGLAGETICRGSVRNVFDWAVNAEWR